MIYERWFVVLFLFLGSALAVWPASSREGQAAKIALVIGNSNYPDVKTTLKHPVADALALGNELRRNNFDVEVAENLTSEGMQRALDRVYGKIRNGSSVLIFFAGYGIQTERRTYLLPTDAQISTEADVRRDGVSIDGILREMDARGAAVKVAILNASPPNPFERRFRDASTGLSSVTAPRGTVIISAAAPGTVVNDGDGENSVFVRELLMEMRSPGLTIEEIFNRTRIGVSRISKREQVPWISSSLMRDFSLSGLTVIQDRPPGDQSSEERLRA